MTSTEAIYSERRTRSQLTLPDNILQIPHRSPLKDARTAMRNYTIMGDTKSVDDSEDELLLSPRKKDPQVRVASSSKRSASPPLHDEYTSTTPPDARAFKRVKRDSPPPENHSDIENLKTAVRFHKRPGQSHSRTQSDSNVLPGRRSAKKRSATPSKPFSTASASPPPSSFSPVATSPRKERAKSVPLFLSTNDIPRIDFWNPPPSPKRKRSPSRSPHKDRTPKLRITSKTFTVSQKLHTIQDDFPTQMDMDDDASSVLEEAEMPPIPAWANPIAAPPTLITSSSQTTLPIIPATPATQSLNKLIPMSPLTPLPPTPFQARLLLAGDAEERYPSELGWGFASKDASASEVVNTPIAPVAPTPIKSRLPRPSLAPPMAPPDKGSRTTDMGPPAIATLLKPTIPTKGNATTSQETPAPKKDAFEVMMKGAQRPQNLDKGKGKMKAKATKPPPPPSIFVKPKEQYDAGPSTNPKPNPKLKERMRPKEKSKSKIPKFEPLPDDEPEDEEEEHPGTGWFSRTEPKKKVTETRPVRLSLEPEVKVQPAWLASTTVVEDSLMESADEDLRVAPTPGFGSVDFDTSVAVAEIPVLQQDKEPQSAAPEPSPEPLLAVVDDVIREGETCAPEPEEVVATKVVETKDATETTTQPSSRTSKLPLGKKRQPISVEPAARVTRSASNSKKIGELLDSADGLSRSTSMAMSRLPAKRTISGAVKKAPSPAEETLLAEPEVTAEAALPPGSPMKMSSPGKTSDKGSPMRKDNASVVHVGPGTLSLIRTPTKSKFSAEKSTSRSSPSKIARSSYMPVKPPVPPGVVRTFSMDNSLVHSGASSSLSTLSNALEKLRMPPPSRPNTSMGFNRDFPGDDDEPDLLTRTQDDGKVGRTSLGLGRTDGGLKRAATLGAGAFKTPTIAPTASAAVSSSKTAPVGNELVQKTLTMFMSSKGAGSLNTVNGPIGRLGVSNNNKRTIFGGIGGGVRRTVSKKTPLPMVLGSPVKGGQGADDVMVADNDVGEDAKTSVTQEASDDNFMAPTSLSTTTTLAEETTPPDGSGKGKQKETRPNFSRRVSSLSYALSQSLSTLPVANPPTKGLMGPPATPPSVGNISNRSTGSNASGSNSASPSRAGTSGATRSSIRIAKSTPALAKVKAGTDGPSPFSNKGASGAVSPLIQSPETRKIMDGCVIFVDVKTEDGDEAGTVFVKMLEDLGARCQGSVGQSCTHIVYKNGLAGTLTKHRLLRGPKPLVVGIGWVVECAEQQKRVDESEFLVDLENAHIAGTHKRRRSMLPKMFSSSIPLPAGLDRDQSRDGDRPVDDASTSISLNDDLTPLERARRRQSILSGPRP